MSVLVCRWCGRAGLSVAHPMFVAEPALDDWLVCMRCFEALEALAVLMPYVRMRNRDR